MTDNAPTRYTRLDGLRFVAISLVLFEHFGIRGDLISAGYYGVDLFFVISGFLITGILLRSPNEEPRKALIRFMGRRALRIFPPYYLLIFILVITGFKPAMEYSASLLTYTFNYSAASHTDHPGQNPLYYLWSLSVEEQFYLIWPLLILGFRKHKAVVIVIIVAVVLVGYAQLLWNIVPTMSRYNYTGLFNRMGSLGLGSLGAAYVSYKAPPRAIFMHRWVEIGVISALAASLTFHFQYRFILMGTCSLFLVVKAAHFEFQTQWLDRFLTRPAVVYVGGISYGIYLFHAPLGHAFTDHLFDPVWKAIPFGEFGPLEKLRWHSWLVKLPVYSGLSIIVAAASHRWFESPILRLKDRWFPAPAKAAVAPN